MKGNAGRSGPCCEYVEYAPDGNIPSGALLFWGLRKNFKHLLAEEAADIVQMAKGNPIAQRILFRPGQIGVGNSGAVGQFAHGHAPFLGPADDVVCPPQAIGGCLRII